MKNKNIAIQLKKCIDSILETKNFFKETIGIDYFEKEYAFLENFREKLNEVNISEIEFKSIELSTKKLIRELNRSGSVMPRLKCILN